MSFVVLSPDCVEVIVCSGLQQHRAFCVVVCAVVCLQTLWQNHHHPISTVVSRDWSVPKIHFVTQTHTKNQWSLSKCQRFFSKCTNPNTQTHNLLSSKNALEQILCHSPNAQMHYSPISISLLQNNISTSWYGEWDNDDSNKMMRERERWWWQHRWW